jgi:hypothetical protein
MTLLLLSMLFVAAASAAQARTAQAATSHASASVNWTARTCAALGAFQSHPSAGNLAALVTDAARLPKGYLKADMFQVAADASSPAKDAWKFLSVSEQYAAQDCWGGA